MFIIHIHTHFVSSTGLGKAQATTYTFEKGIDCQAMCVRTCVHTQCLPLVTHHSFKIPFKTRKAIRASLGANLQLLFVVAYVYRFDDKKTAIGIVLVRILEHISTNT